MRLNEIRFTDALPIDGYGAGFFRIGGEAVDAPLIVSHRGVEAWGGYDDGEALLALAEGIDVLLVGTGPEIARLPAGLRDRLEAAGVGVETMASAQAARSFNILLAEGRRVAVALLPV
ncbi:Mth938-like domain-containing protein [Histidinibacterium lentulum]|uniref:Mth938-like domain-containing protein n=1 Tax=Histidinibacterium lentulum TaxID=2480588 RepID=A0A3N2R4D8_9RHOB|nr:Mth938-like domain-containing protein [Histidinibacterium lentulum]ROU02359.1 hypothetical protein EAT49_08405 [Histidinibacterium lentulum]